MAATTRGAIKAWLESGGLGIAVYNRNAPDDASYPYVTVEERISVTPEAHGDNGADAAVREQVQVNVWQPASSTDNELVDQVIQRLHGATLATAPSHVYGVTVDFASYIPDPDPTVVHDQITCSVRRALQEA